MVMDAKPLEPLIKFPKGESRNGLEKMNKTQDGDSLKGFNEKIFEEDKKNESVLSKDNPNNQSEIIKMDSKDAKRYSKIDNIELSVKFPELKVFKWSEKKGIKQIKHFIVDENILENIVEVSINTLDQISHLENAEKQFDSLLSVA